MSSLEMAETNIPAAENNDRVTENNDSVTQHNDVVNVAQVQEVVEQVEESKVNELFYCTLVDLLKLETYNTNNNVNLLFSNKTKEVVTKNVQQLLYITIIDVLKASIQNSNASIAIDDKTKEIITKLIEVKTTLFVDIVNSVLNIIQDNKIDSKDVPIFMLLLQQLYEILYSLKELKKLSKSEIADSCGLILKFILHMLVDEGHIVIAEERKVEFLGEMDILIDTCISLIQLTKSLKPPSCIKKLFCC
jgi:hypothetical protein